MSEIAAVEREAFSGARGAWKGLASTLSGVRFVVLRPRSWPTAIIPAAIASLLFSACAGGLGWLAWHQTASLRESVPGYIVSALLMVVAVILAGVLALSLAQPLAGFALDDLSRMRETTMGGVARADDDTFFTTAWRSLRVTMTGLLVGGPLLLGLALISALFPPAAVVTVPLKVVVSSLVVAWDLLDYPFGLRKMRVRERLAWMRANAGAVLLFGATSGAILLIPLLGLLMLPCGVAASTELVVRVERERATPA